MHPRDRLTHPPATKVIFILGGIGVVVHLVSLHWRVFHVDPTDASTFLMVAVADSTLVLLGGLFYALLLRWPVNEAARSGKHFVAAILVGGLFGSAATVSALQGSYVASAIALVWKEKMSVPDVSLRSAFLLSIMEVETYGLIETVLFILPGAMIGALVTALVARWVRLSTFQPSNSSIPSASVDPSN